MADLLAGVRVVEVAGELTGYTGRLLADLGASVTRVALSPDAAAETGVPAAPLGPDGPDAAALFLHRGKEELLLDRAALDALAAAADVLLESHEGGAERTDAAALRARNPRLVHAVVSPFGLAGPRAGDVSTDLVRLAAGGLLWLGGYPDAEPVAPFGGQSTLAAGLYAAVAVLLALVERESTGAGRLLEVSAQEVISQALETSLAEVELTGRVRTRLGDVPREAATGVYACADGHVSMVAGRLGTAPAWRRLREWLLEAEIPGAAELLEEEWESLSFRQTPEAIERFAAVFGAFAATRTKSELYVEAQARNIALAPVNTLADVLADPQLAARGFFKAEGALRLPAPPFRIEGAQVAAPA
jgi:benzylsuccinate CoA-transferase BbsE subunit